MGLVPLNLSSCFLNPGKHLASCTFFGKEFHSLTKCYAKLFLWFALNLPLASLFDATLYAGRDGEQFPSLHCSVL